MTDTFKPNEVIEVETQDGWKPGTYEAEVKGKHYVTCNHLWYGLIEIPADKFRRPESKS